MTYVNRKIHAHESCMYPAPEANSRAIIVLLFLSRQTALLIPDTGHDTEFLQVIDDCRSVFLHMLCMSPGP
jgi:hypothetical protein